MNWLLIAELYCEKTTFCQNLHTVSARLFSVCKSTPQSARSNAKLDAQLLFLRHRHLLRSILSVFKHASSSLDSPPGDFTLPNTLHSFHVHRVTIKNVDLLCRPAERQPRLLSVGQGYLHSSAVHPLQDNPSERGGHQSAADPGEPLPQQTAGRRPRSGQETWYDSHSETHAHTHTHQTCFK